MTQEELLKWWRRGQKGSAWIKNKDLMELIHHAQAEQREKDAQLMDQVADDLLKKERQSYEEKASYFAREAAQAIRDQGKEE